MKVFKKKKKKLVLGIVQILLHPFLGNLVSFKKKH